MTDFVIEDKYLGQTVSLNISVYNTEDPPALADASSVTYSVKYPDGTLAVDKTAATHGSTGQYTINYTLPAETTGQEGKYKLTIYITGDNTDIQTTSFEVEASI
jgi:uncharacterized protein YfaS (alpha-2-macroglobulin family)